MSDAAPATPTPAPRAPGPRHRRRTRVLADRGLLGHRTVRAAAGTPRTVFPLDPASLTEYAQGRIVDVRERTA
ncbi:hypothetical protein [Streptomyces sp. NPDC053427]|uniref:hypothetical protein n=1 Tax=Streptomyces sp. NPDC053427 TaxID=3365701 RepID=UPI0037D5177C